MFDLVLGPIKEKSVTTVGLILIFSAAVLRVPERYLPFGDSSSTLSGESMVGACVFAFKSL